MNYIFCLEKRIHTYFVIGFNYDPDTVAIVKKIPTATYNPPDKKWYVQVSPETAPKVSRLISTGFDCTEDVLDRIENIIGKNDYLLELSDSDDSGMVLPDLPHELYPFQKSGIEYMCRAKRCFNADSMGLGKTVQTLVSIEKSGCYPHIIICPDKMKKKWREHVSDWLPHRTSMILSDDNFYYTHDILITNYEAVIKYLVIEKRDPDHSKFKVMEHIKRLGIKGVTCDESHYLKTPKSKRTKAVRQLCKDIEYVWMLSGTVVNNRPEELISQLQIMGRLHDFGGYNFFIKRYCDAKQGYGGHIKKSGAKNLVELNEKLRKVCMVRRTKKDVLKELPGKVIHKIPVEINNREEYNLAKEDIFEWMDQRRRRSNDNPLGLVTKENEQKLYQDAVELQILNALRIITAEGKLNDCIEWIKQFLKTGKKLVIFAHHKKIQKRVIKEFPNSARILGGMNASVQKRNEDLFKTDHCQTIICSLKAANTGIDLVSGYNYICLEYDWTPSTHDQAEDRLNRIGQHNKVNCYYPTAIDTIEEDIFVMHEMKREIMRGIMDGEEYEKELDIRRELINLLKKQGKINIPTNNII